jgi:hypothetical protein
MLPHKIVHFSRKRLTFFIVCSRFGLGNLLFFRIFLHNVTATAFSFADIISWTTFFTEELSTRAFHGAKTAYFNTTALANFSSRGTIFCFAKHRAFTARVTNKSQHTKFASIGLAAGKKVLLSFMVAHLYHVTILSTARPATTKIAVGLIKASPGGEFRKVFNTRIAITLIAIMASRGSNACAHIIILHALVTGTFLLFLYTQR